MSVLKNKILVAYYSQIVTQVVGFVSGIIVARLAGPTVMGTLAFGLSFVSMFRFLQQMGLDTAHIKLISGGEDTGKCNATFAVLKTVAIILFVLVVTSNYFIQTKVFGITFETPEHKWVIFIWILITVVNGIISIPKTTFIARIERAKVDITAMVRDISTKLLRVLVAAIGLGAVYLAFAELSVLILFIFVYFWLYRKLPFSKFDWDLAKKYLRFSLPLILISIFVSIYNYIDKIFLQYLSNTAELGYFSVGFTFSRPIRLLGESVSALFFPTFSKLFSQGESDRIRELVAKFDRFLFIFVFPFVILFMIYSPTFVPLFLGEQYINSIKVVSLISLSMFIYILQLPYGNMIFALGKFKQAAIIQFINLSLLIFYIVILVSKKFFFLGANGNAIAILLSNITLFVMTFGTMKKYMKNLKLFYDRKITIAYILIFGFLYLIYQFLFVNQLNVLIYIYPFFFVIFVFGLMTLLKLITTQDWRQFLNLFKLKELFSYIKSEFRS